MIDEFIWLCFTDRGIVYFEGNIRLSFIENLFKLQSIKNYECHYVNNETTLIALQSYMEDCFGIEYNGVN